MVSPGMADPTVEVVRGEAMVEVDHLPKPARLSILERGADASLLKEGLYKFDADEGRIAVVDGKAEVTENGQTARFGKATGGARFGTAIRRRSTSPARGMSTWPADGVRAGTKSLFLRMVMAAGRRFLPKPVWISVLLARVRDLRAILRARLLPRRRPVCSAGS
jgi:hypothetical protein